MPTAFPTTLLPHIKPLALLKVIPSKLSAARASVDRSRKAIEKFIVITTKPIVEMGNSEPRRVKGNKRQTMTIWLDKIKNLLLDQLISPVLWHQSISHLNKNLGVQIFLEVGPKNVLSGLIKRIAPDCEISNFGEKADLEKL